MKVTIKTIPHESQRYPTVGDWEWDKNGNLTISVSDMGDWHYEMLVAIHELVEVLLCKHRGIRQEDVDAFDKLYESMRKRNDLSEPGDSISAPYYDEHQFATCIEKLVATQLGVNWQLYDKTVGEL